MHDWKAIVKAQLPSLTPEVIEELAAHLEDCESFLLAEGTLPAEAFERTRRELIGSPDLAKRIEQARGDQMNHRSKVLWLPGLASFAASAVSLAILQRIALHTHAFLTAASNPRTDHWFAASNFLPYFAWLLCQPLCGALGAGLSKRAGGGTLEFVGSGIFPSLIMFAMMVLLFPFAIFVEKNPYILSHLGDAAIGLGAWVGLPGAFLLLGTLPFWRSSGAARKPLVQ